MPRIRPSLFWRARCLGEHVVRLLPICRDVRTSQNELRWIMEHAFYLANRYGLADPSRLLRNFVARRAQGEPIQYIIGSEFFGDLEIKCRPGVLIPRQDTAASIIHLANRLKSRAWAQKTLRVVDICTGSGCIPLLFHHEYFRNAKATLKPLELVGVDVSSNALSLARENLIHQIAVQKDLGASKSPMRTTALVSTGFVQADVMAKDSNEDSAGSMPVVAALQRLVLDDKPQSFDVLISNPPYISPKGFRATTSRSVRLFEPELALVPEGRRQGATDTEIADTFYPELIRIADELSTRVLLFEVADLAQATRVTAMLAHQGTWDVIEIWRDEPDRSQAEEPESICVCDRTINVLGVGNGRSVFASRLQYQTES